MNWFAPDRKCVVFCLLLFVLSDVTAFGRTKEEISKPEVPDIEKIHQRIRIDVTTGKDRRAEEAYEKRDTEINPWIKSALPPNPDNAALLYYQAFLLRPDLNINISRKIDDVLTGAMSDRELRTYLGHCLPMIHVAEIASRIPQCTWGIWDGLGLKFSKGRVRSEVWDLSRILLVDARTLAADGHYRAALDRCLSVRRFVQHLGEDSRLDVIARNPDVMALRTIQYVLGVTPPDAEILIWFRAKLAMVQGLPLSFGHVLQSKSKSFLELMQTNPDTIALLKNLYVQGSENEPSKKKSMNLKKKQIVSRASIVLEQSINLIQQILDSEMTYEQKLAQMQRLIEKLEEENGSDPISKNIIILSGIRDLIYHQYPFLVGHAAHINGIKAAVEVYLVVAKTGQLPEKLPDYLPKDPFTGRDFVYAITDEGFDLRCQGEEFLRRKNQFLEFKVCKKG